MMVGDLHDVDLFFARLIKQTRITDASRHMTWPHQNDRPLLEDQHTS